MLEERVSQRALQSLVSQDDYLRPLNPSAADGLAQDIDRTLKLLSAFPELGRQIEGTRLRVHVTRRFRFRLVYRATPEAIELREVLHPRQRSRFDE